MKRIATLLGLAVGIACFANPALATQAADKSPVPFLSSSPKASPSAVPASPSPKPKPVVPANWYPRGYELLSGDGSVAGKWNTKGDPCGYSRCNFINLTAVAEFGCPDGLFITVNFLKNGVVVDDSIDSISGLRPMQKVNFVFKTYESANKVQLSDVNCYSY